jgi:rhodanese-related sulfurtransferase
VPDPCFNRYTIINHRYVLFDVRERDEFAAGSIGTAVNIPLGEWGEALTLDPDDFENVYGVCLLPTRQNVPPLRLGFLGFCPII